MKTIISIVMLLTSWHLWATTDTDDLALSASIDNVRIRWSETPDERSSWWQWFEYHIKADGVANGYRRFGPLSRFSWAQSVVLDDPHRQRAERQGESLFVDTVTDGVIDAFRDWFDFDRFKQDDHPGLTFGAKLAEGTMNTAEGHIRPIAIDPEDVVSFDGWIKSFTRVDRVKYGFNLINSNPYFYYSTASFRKKNGLPSIIQTTRIRMDFIHLDFAQPQLEEEIIFPISLDTKFSIGGRVYPLSSGDRDHRPSLVIKITHMLERHRQTGDLIYCSVRINEHEQLYVLGLALDNLFEK